MADIDLTKNPSAPAPEAGPNPVFRLGRVTFWIILTFLLYLFSRKTYAGFHTLVEVVSIATTWGLFLLLWNAKKYLEEEAYLVLGIALTFSGGLDLMHTMSYKGFNVFGHPDAANHATQFWVAARIVETLGWFSFALLFKRKGFIRRTFLFFLPLSILMILAIMRWEIFPVCFDGKTGLTGFKVGMEYAMIAFLGFSLFLFRHRSGQLDPVISRNLQSALIMIILAEMAFTLYTDVFGLSNLIGHFLRIVSRYSLYIALIRLSIVNPYSLFFTTLQKEKEKLAESELRWRSLSESSPDHILDIDQDLNIRFANYPSPGLTMNDLLGHSILEFLPENDTDRVKKILLGALSSRTPVIFETEFQDQPGLITYFETTVVARELGINHRPGLTLVVRNITERKRRGQVFSARLEISEYALNHDIPDLLQKVLDEAEKLTGSRIGFFHFVDHDQENLHLQNWSSRTLREICTAEGHGSHYPLSQAGVWADCVREKRALIHNDYQSLPNRKGMPEGHAPVVREVVIPLMRKDQVVAVIGVGNKASDYVQADVDLLAELSDMAWDIVVRKRAELALMESERYLARTLANLPGMVFRCANDPDWTFEFASESCIDLTGYNPEDLIGNRTVSFASLIHPDDREMVNNVVQESFLDHSTYQVTYRITPRQGPVKWVWEQGRGIFQGNQIDKIEGFIYDITEQVKSLEERRALEKKVQETQKLESLGVLAGGIAHDFNNLLQAMLGFAELAGHQIGAGHPAQESIGRVLESASRAAELTRQMLAFSGRGQFTTRRVNLSAQVNGMANLLESSVPKNIVFSRDLPPDLPPVSVDIAQFQQLVLNFITNAAEAIGESGGTIQLRTGLCECDEEYLAKCIIGSSLTTPGPLPGTFAMVEVQDSGCGMDSATLDRIFEPFFSTKFTGRGLGLAAVQGIIRGHDGALMIDSQVGAGTTFRALFPVSHGKMDEEKVRDDTPSQSVSGQPVILVVDDESEVRDLMRSTLERNGYSVLCAQNGREALDVFSHHASDVACVLLDLVMPEMGGEECLPQLRKISPDVKIVLMSGYSELEIKRRFTGQDISGLLPKPFLGKELLEVLERVLPVG